MPAITQSWTERLPQKNTPYTLKDYSNAFDAYWAPYNVEGGYYTDENGERQKAAGWKLFKRFEWYWSDRVDPVTGAFPQKNRIEAYQAEKPRFRRTTGRNAGGGWTSLGPNASPGGYAGLGRINVIGFRPGDAATYYAGAPSGGLWRTTDDGQSWTPLTDQNDALGVSDILIFPGASPMSDTLYIGTGDRDGGSLGTLLGGQSADNNGVGILRSYDGGATWEETGLAFDPAGGTRISRMLRDPNQDSTMLASVLGFFSNQGSVHKSTDRGETWQKVADLRFIDMEYKPGSSDTVYAASDAGKIYRSLDGGLSWNEILLNFGPGRIELAVTPADADRIYAIVANQMPQSLHAIWRSDNFGNAWAKVYDGASPNQNLLGYQCDASDNRGQGGYDLCIAADPADADNVYIGGINLWRSTDGGISWTISSHWSQSCNNAVDVVHADQHFLGFQPGTNHLFNGNDGGVYKSTDDGVSWTWKGNGMAISQVYRIGISQLASGTYISGSQDNGTKSANANTWGDRIGGDGMECIIDFTTPSTQYGARENGVINITTDHWITQAEIYPKLPPDDKIPRGAWVTPYTLDPTDNQTIYAGYQHLWKSDDQGNTWQKLPRPALRNPNPLQSLAVWAGNPNNIYIADNDSLYQSVDGGQNWALITGTLPVADASMTYISVSHASPDTVWVSMGQYNEHGVYQTTDGGATWENISIGLPEVPVMCVIQNIRDTGQLHLYAATDIGVYVKVGDANWSRFSDGLPNVVTTELEIFYPHSAMATPKIRAATYGRGVWESDIYVETNTPVTDFEADNRYPDTGAVVSFTDRSDNLPNDWKWVIEPMAGVAFVNGTADTSVNPQVTFANEGTYSVKLVTANGIGSDSLTKADYITVTNLVAGYCAANGGSGFGAIRSVTFGDIENKNSGISPGGYGDFTDRNTAAAKGDQTELRVEIQLNNPSDTLDLGVWIDWNRDGDFDDLSEEIGCLVNVPGGEAMFQVTIPAWAQSGKTRLRIRSKFFGPGCGIPCGSTANGEVEDYSIVVIPGTPVQRPTADFMADNTMPSINNGIRFTDLSTDLPESWSWSFLPDDVIYLNGTSSTTPFPEVAFTTTGLHTVQLIASNSIGADTLVKTNYIDVQEVSYCPAASDGGLVGIQRVTLENIDRISSLSPGNYADYTGTDSTVLTIGNQYDLTVLGINPQGANDYVAWIDWNADGDFDDPGEALGCSPNFGNGTVFQFTVPANAYPFPTVLRIRSAFNLNCAMPPSCGNTGFGEVEDYRINIVAGDILWTGAVSTDWFDPANWNANGVPTRFVNVIIPSAPSGGNFPVISTGKRGECYDMTIQTGATVTVNGELEMIVGN